MTWVDYNSQNWVQQEALTNEIIQEFRRIESKKKQYERFRRIAGNSIPHEAIDKEIDMLDKLRMELMAIAEYQYGVAENARKEEWG